MCKKYAKEKLRKIKMHLHKYTSFYACVHIVQIIRRRKKKNEIIKCSIHDNNVDDKWHRMGQEYSIHIHIFLFKRRKHIFHIYIGVFFFLSVILFELCYFMLLRKWKQER